LFDPEDGLTAKEAAKEFRVPIGRIRYIALKWPECVLDKPVFYEQRLIVSRKLIAERMPLLQQRKPYKPRSIPAPDPLPVAAAGGGHGTD
jgi:hypothetical protein